MTRKHASFIDWALVFSFFFCCHRFYFQVRGQRDDDVWSRNLETDLRQYCTPASSFFCKILQKRIMMMSHVFFVSGR